MQCNATTVPLLKSFHRWRSIFLIAGGHYIIRIFLAEIDFHKDFSCRKTAAYWIMINDDADDAEDDDDDDVDGWI